MAVHVGIRCHGKRVDPRPADTEQQLTDVTDIYFLTINPDIFDIFFNGFLFMHGNKIEGIKFQI